MRLNSGVREEADRLLRLRYTPSEVLAELDRSPDWDKAELPHLRTIQRYAREIVARTGFGGEGRKADEQWTVADARPEDAALVLPVLRALTSAMRAFNFSLTKTDADWIARLRRVAPSIPPLLAFDFARRYQEWTAPPAPTAKTPFSRMLDVQLAFETWTEVGKGALLEAMGSRSRREAPQQRKEAGHE